MKAIIYESYGPADVLKSVEIAKPIPKDDEVLIQVHATSVTAGDWRLRKADPFLARIFNGLFKPTRVKILGFEVSGIVVEAGKNVKMLKKGDEVFASCGLKFGGYAEYKCISENEIIAKKPKNITFEEAATIPIGGLTALRLLTQSGDLYGKKILIYGASGSVGTFSVQLAKLFGAEVTAVCSGKNEELVRSIGADDVVDYTKTDITKLNKKFDVILDAVGKINRSKAKNILAKNGSYVSVRKSVKPTKDDLQTLADIISMGELTSVIDRTYTLDNIQEAHKYVEQFHKMGNVAITITPQPNAN